MNIWRCSITLQHQSQASEAEAESRGAREELERELWHLIMPGTTMATCPV